MLLAAMLLHWPLDASALGLSELSVYSALNEPFYAEIPLTSAGDKELKTLRARVVDRPDFDAPGFQRGLLSPVRVTLVSEGGRHILRIRSEHSVNEPFVRFLLQVDWAGGRLQREFTALIDPRAPGEAPVLPPPEAQAADQQRSVELDVSGPPSSEPTIARADAKKTPQAITAPDPVAAKTVLEETPDAPRRAREAADRPKPEQAVKAAESDTDDRSRVAQRERIESEIRAWAEEQQQDRRKGADEDERSAKPQEKAPAVSASPPVVQKLPPRAQVPAAPAPADNTVEPTLFEWVLQNRGQLFALLVLSIGAGVVIAGVAVAFVLYRRRRLAVGTSDALEEFAQPEPDEGVTLLAGEDVDNRRRGPGRRHRFIPVAIERRQGPRRASDRVQTTAQVVYPVEADTTEEAHTYMALGRTEDAEQALRDAITRQPWRHSLKVKLLAVLYRQGNRDAFETLINQLYIALEDEAAPQRRSAGSSEGQGSGQRHSGVPLSGEWAVNAAAADEAETLLMGKQQPQPMGDVEPQSQTPESKAPQTFEYPKKGRQRDLQEPLVEALEALELELPHVDTDALEGDMEVLDMDVPKGEDDEPTHLIMAGADPSGQAAPADRRAKPDKDAEGDVGTAPLTGEDLEDIRSAVTRGIELLETAPAEVPGDDRASSSTSGKGRPTRDKRRAQRSGKPSQQGARMRWHDPAIRIDLAKAYIDMGDVERARRILEEVLEAWHRGSGTRA